jgi:hypothetical protein
MGGARPCRAFENYKRCGDPFGQGFTMSEQRESNGGGQDVWQSIFVSRNGQNNRKAPSYREGLDLPARMKITFATGTPSGQGRGRQDVCLPVLVPRRTPSKKATLKVTFLLGGPGGTRTPNTHLRTVVFYPLNYRTMGQFYRGRQKKTTIK